MDINKKDDLSSTETLKNEAGGNQVLEHIKNPGQVRNLSIAALEELAKECRERIIDVVSKKGGHLASSLGTVELTIALLKTFNFNQDKIVWDVGHQAYTYKILTKRNKDFEQIGSRGGIAKFLRRAESEYDHFGAGHASTSISAALGMAVENEKAGNKNKSIAVIGDGAMTGGLAFEALNHAGDLDQNMIVILNDNEMSIGPNVGGFTKTIMNFQSSKPVNMVRNEVATLVKDGKLPPMVKNTLKKINESFMTFFTPGGWFEQFDFRYFGPVDGHDIKSLVALFEQTKDLKGPLLLHVITKKGKGYSFAEGNAFNYHGVGAFEPTSGKFLKKSAQGKTYTQIWGKAFEEIMENDPLVVGTSAAMIGNTGMSEVQQKFPDRIFDVGIAEGHAVTFSAGMATGKLKPFVVVYSTFMQRAFDHIIHDVALQNLPVRFILDRGGLVGPDGATHHGTFDLGYLRMIPNMVILVPKNGEELQRMLNTAHQYNDGPIAIRFPRSSSDQFLEEKQDKIEPIQIGKGEVLKEGEDILLVAVGTMVETAEIVAQNLKEEEGINCSVINARSVKPLDEKLISQYAKKVKLIATLEENQIMGGFGSAVIEMLHKKDILKPVKLFGIPDYFIEYGTQEEQLKEAGINPEVITEKLKINWFNLN